MVAPALHGVQSALFMEQGEVMKGPFFLKCVLLIAVSAATVAGCARSSITPVARNQALINTSAAPVCGTDGAAAVAAQMAAVATIRQGYERYVIAGGNVQDNTRVFVTGPTHATTTGSVSAFGNAAYGRSTTTYGGRQMMVGGRNNAQVGLVMFNSGDRVMTTLSMPKPFLAPTGAKRWPMASTPVDWLRCADFGEGSDRHGLPRQPVDPALAL